MEYVLARGHIYIPAEPPAIIAKARKVLRAKDNIEAVVKRIHYPYLWEVVQNYQAHRRPKYGCQILASCKQLYCEGYRIFYERNVFHLAPGPLSTSSQYFENLQPHHRSLIRHLAIDTSALDLTQKFATALEKKMNGERIHVSTLFTHSQLFTLPIFGYMREMLSSKLEYVCSWQGAVDLKLQHRSVSLRKGPDPPRSPMRILTRGFFIQENDLKEALDNIGERIRSGQLRDRQMISFESCALIEVALATLGRVDRTGWEGFRVWLHDGGPYCLAVLDSRYASASDRDVWSQVGKYDDYTLCRF